MALAHIRLIHNVPHASVAVLLLSPSSPSLSSSSSSSSSSWRLWRPRSSRCRSGGGTTRPSRIRTGPICRHPHVVIHTPYHRSVTHQQQRTLWQEQRRTREHRCGTPRNSVAAPPPRPLQHSSSRVWSPFSALRSYAATAVSSAVCWTRAALRLPTSPLPSSAPMRLEYAKAARPETMVLTRHRCLCRRHHPPAKICPGWRESGRRRQHAPVK